MVKRRHFVTAAASGTLAFSGCLWDTPKTETVQIYSVRLFNDDSVPHEVTLQIAANDVVFQESYQLDSKSLTTVKHPVTTEGDYTLNATVDGGTVRTDFSESIGEKYTCVSAAVRVLREGRLAPVDVTPYTEC